MAKTEWKQTDGKVVSVGSMSTRGRLQFIVRFTYEVEGETYEGKFYTFNLTHKDDPPMVKYDVSIPIKNKLAARQERINIPVRSNRRRFQAARRQRSDLEPGPTRVEVSYNAVSENMIFRRRDNSQRVTWPVIAS